MKTATTLPTRSSCPEIDLDDDAPADETSDANDETEDDEQGPGDRAARTQGRRSQQIGSPPR